MRTSAEILRTLGFKKRTLAVKMRTLGFKLRTSAEILRTLDCKNPLPKATLSPPYSPLPILSSSTSFAASSFDKVMPFPIFS
jgi:hypothetical protein